ncbi:MAG: prepilin-type N-terminal cleavage/methylation domain-containing protein [Patescibacteria group bacterium]
MQLLSIYNPSKASAFLEASVGLGLAARSARAGEMQKRQAGFTLIEVVIAMAILAGILSLGLFMSIDSLHSTYSRSERDLVVSVLEKARSRALANIDESAWGVCYVAPNYILFKSKDGVCVTGVASNEATQAGAGVTVTGLAQGTPIVFAQLSGIASPATPTTPVDVVINQQNKTSTVSINYEGAIIW